MHDQHVVLELFNHSNHPRTIVMEPWGEELLLPSGVAWTLTSDRSPNGALSIDFYEEVTAIYGLRNAVMRIYQGDDVVWECFQPFDPPAARQE